jgi:hypothetical protein
MLTNSALVFEPKCGGVCGVSASEYSCTHGAQRNFGDLTPYLTYVSSHAKESLTLYIYHSVLSLSHSLIKNLRKLAEQSCHRIRKNKEGQTVPAVSGLVLYPSPDN